MGLTITKVNVKKFLVLLFTISCVHNIHASTVCVGDSIMYLSCPYIPGAINKAIPGQTSDGLLSSVLQTIQDEHPSELLILIGTNDYDNAGQNTQNPSTDPGHTLENLMSIITLAKSFNVQKIIIGTVPPVNPNPLPIYITPNYDPVGRENYVENQNRINRIIGGIQGVKIAEVWQSLEPVNSSMFIDKMHFQDPGDHIIANAFINAE